MFTWSRAHNASLFPRAAPAPGLHTAGAIPDGKTGLVATDSQLLAGGGVRAGDHRHGSQQKAPSTGRHCSSFSFLESVCGGISPFSAAPCSAVPLRAPWPHRCRGQLCRGPRGTVQRGEALARAWCVEAWTARATGPGQGEPVHPAGQGEHWQDAVWKAMHPCPDPGGP